MSSDEPLSLGVSDFVALLNQTLEFAYPLVVITGELANFRISKNRWVYFDLKDELASVKFFGTVYQLPGPLEDGLLLQVRGQPRLHPLYGFNVNVQSMQAAGEGSIKRAAALLEAKLAAEGLFEPARKRTLPYPPERIGLIASSESAAYVDFMKILNERWGGVAIELADVQVQGEPAVAQIVAAIEHFNAYSLPPEVLIITRGGGNAEDLAVFSTEQVTRAVAASRIPTLVAIGHEVDISLAELAADQRASTPSNAAELLVPDKRQVLERLDTSIETLLTQLQNLIKIRKAYFQELSSELQKKLDDVFLRTRERLQGYSRLLQVLSPAAALHRGYAVIRDKNNKLIRSIFQIAIGTEVHIMLADGTFEATIVDKSKTRPTI